MRNPAFLFPNSNLWNRTNLFLFCGTIQPGEIAKFSGVFPKQKLLEEIFAIKTQHSCYKHILFTVDYRRTCQNSSWTKKNSAIKPSFTWWETQHFCSLIPISEIERIYFCSVAQFSQEKLQKVLECFPNRNYSKKYLQLKHNTLAINIYFLL